MINITVVRDRLWRFAVRNHPEGMVLTKPLKFVRAILYPLDTFYWRMRKARGYQWESDTWIIYGVRYSSVSLMALAEARGGTYRITRNGECVTLERINE